MSDFVVCRICLASDDVKLHSIYNFNLLEAYNNVVGDQICKMEDGLPEFICSYCSSLLLKFVAFKDKCIDTRSILLHAVERQLTAEDILSINDQYKLPYATSTDCPTIHMKYTENAPKIELIIQSQFEVDDVQRNKKNKKTKGDLGIKSEDDSFNDNYENDNCENDTIENDTENDTNENYNYEISVNDYIDYSEFKDVEVHILSKEEQLQEIEERKTSANYLNSLHKCNFCYKGFITTSTFNNHMAKHEPERGDHVCEICKSRWPEARSLRAHILNTHEKKYICKLCEFVSRNIHRAKEHLKWHKGFMFLCKICGATFAKSTSHLTHIRLQHPSKNSCELCGESFIGEHGLKMHKKKVHSTETFTAQCDHCKTKFQSIKALKRHFKLSNNETCDGVSKFCRYCGEGYETEEQLKQHLKDNHEDESSRCDECARSFKNARSLSVHRERVHLGVKRALTQRLPRRPHENVVCEQCGLQCTSKATLMYHQRTHTGEKPYQCTQCPKKFSMSQLLQIHVRTHTGERPFKCPTCPKAFRHKAALNRHSRVHTGVKPYSCPHCNKCFSQSNSMKYHIKTVHLKMPAPYRSRRNKIDVQ